MQFPGEFETHLTVRLAEGQTVESLRAAPAARGLKCTHIVLARGRAPSQPMLTRDGRGTLAGELAEATALRGALEGDGFAVSRVKVEAAPWNDDVPESDGDGAAQPAHRYFEHHVKMLLDEGVDARSLAELAQRHAAHLSHNALRRRDDGRLERFVTQRCHGVGRDTARARLEALLADLRGGQYDVIDVEEEFVVYDSDLSLDAGWIEPEGARP
jgi:hypothetical protein